MQDSKPLGTSDIINYSLKKNQSINQKFNLWCQRCPWTADGLPLQHPYFSKNNKQFTSHFVLCNVLYVAPCNVMSCQIHNDNIMPCYVISCYITSSHVTSRHLMLQHVISCYNTLSHVTSRHLMLHHVISCYITSSHVTSCIFHCSSSHCSALYHSADQ